MIDKNTSYTSHVNNSLYSHSYEFISNAIDKDTKQNLKKSMQDIKHKLKDPEFFKEKIKNLLISRFAPLTTPADLESQIKETKFELVILSKMVHDRKIKLDVVNKKLIAINKEFSKIKFDHKPTESQKTLFETKNKLKTEKKSIEDQFTRFNFSLKILKENLAYFETRVKLETSGRFNGYIGQAVNAVVKTGPLAAVALTAANTAVQVKLAYDLPANSRLSAKEKKNARYNSMVTLACTAASVVFSLYIFPTVKETAWYLWNYKLV